MKKNLFVEPPVSNFRLISKKPDPMAVDKLILKTEVRVVKAIQLAQKMINKIVTPEDVKNIESSVELQSVDYDLDQIQNNMDTIANRLSSEITDIMDASIEHGYRAGRGYAQRKINIMLNRTGGPGPVSRRDRELIKLLRDTNLNRVTTLSQRHIAEARAILATGLIDGLSQTEITQQMMQRLHIVENQARLIVRTEIIRSANVGARKQYLNSGITHWQWQTVRKREEAFGRHTTGAGERVCNICKPLHGKIVEIGAPFNPFLSESGRRRLKDPVLRQPPAHPNCRCAMAPAYPPKRKARVKPPAEAPRVKIVRSTMKGFTNWEKLEIRQLIAHIPNDVKKKVKALRGENDIRKTSGRLIDDNEIKNLIPPTIRNKYRNATALYIGGNVNKIFISSTASENEVMHEIGHAVFDEYLKLHPSVRRNWENIHNIHLQTGDFITYRASTSLQDHFSEAFRFYLLKPAILRLRFPEIYDFFFRDIFFGNERDSIVTLEDGFKIQNNRGKWYEYKYGKNGLPHPV